MWFPTPVLVPREGTDANTPLLWRVPWPRDLIDKLVSDDNPTGTVTSAEFELAGGLLQLDTLAHCYDIRERTIVSKTDNLNTMFWERKGSCTTDSSPAYLLRLFGIHQRHHRYISRHDYQPGISNKMADDASPPTEGRVEDAPRMLGEFFRKGFITTVNIGIAPRANECDTGAFSAHRLVRR